MLHLPSKSLSTTTQNFLDKLQKQVDSKPTFKDKADKAQSLWLSKRRLKGF
jgi:hypothetical protein